MSLLGNDYCGDTLMKEYLKKAGSKLSLSEIYGLLCGALAGPNMVMPSKMMPMIFGEEGGDFESMEEAKEAMGNLMSLWNVVAGWKPESGPFFYANSEYPKTDAAVMQRVNNDLCFINSFIKGLDLSVTDENDFSEDGLQALESLGKANALLTKYAELIEMKDEEGDKEFERTTDSIDKLEGPVEDCIARISIGLKEARMRCVEEMRSFANAPEEMYQARGTKIPRNSPCPCGSGKKYKKCCGLSH
jgi:uncharacterized protein